MLSRLATLTLVGSSLACGNTLSGVTATDSGTDANATHDTSTTPDTGGQAQDAAEEDSSVVCAAATSYAGTLTNETATYTPNPADAGADAGPQDGYQLLGSLNAVPDALDIELYDGYGVFANGITPGTYQLTGSELDYATCGLCVLVLASYSAQNGGDPYMATAGTITITAASPTGSLTGTGMNLTFTHVSIDSNTLESTPLGDGCNSSIASVTFSATVTTM